MPEIVVEQVNNSKIDNVDFSDLTFGKTFTDHMLICEWKDGKWQNARIKPYGPMSLDPSAKVFHYGQALFEGMKAFKDDKGKIWLFRPTDNADRLNLSAERLAMPTIPVDFFMHGLKKLISLDSEWVRQGEELSLYIRPFMIASEYGVAAAPSTEYTFMIILSPAMAYYKGDVRVQFATKFSRAADGGVGYAKAAGNYAASFYPTNLAREAGYQQVIWTDAKEHKYLEEAGTMNMFFRVGDKLLTAPTSDRILNGVTRRSIIQLAKDSGITVEERPVEVAEIVEASKNGELKEIFGTGTAAVIVPVKGFLYEDYKFELPRQDKSYAESLMKHLKDIQYNRAADPHGWRVAVD